MDVTLSMMSMFGLIALSGVVVNDSLVMVSYINRKRAEHVDLGTAASAPRCAKRVYLGFGRFC